MSSHLPSEITAGLVSLRRRIRRIQFFRGLLRTSSVVLVGLLLIVGLDFLITPFPAWARATVFFLWLAAIAISAVGFIVKPMLVKLPLLRLARWLEERHPEVQERISTALELADQSSESGGISPALLADLSAEAAVDMSQVDPRQEVESKRVHQAMVPVGATLVALIVLVAVWPRQMERLISRAVSPFSELGNVGAFQFEMSPGDFEVLEGESFAIDLTFTGLLDQPLEFVIKKEGETFIEALQPTNSEAGAHRFSYPVHSADFDFKYSARVAGSESDRFEVKVYSLPQLLDPVVVFQYPPYTGWPDREAVMSPTVQALAGTEVTVKGRFETPLESAELLLDSASFGEVILDPSARGTAMTWSGVLKPGLDEAVVLQVKHQLGSVLDAAQFSLLATEDPAPVVKILTPVQREFRVKPDEQVNITYEVIEHIDLVKAEIQLEVNGKPVEPLLELLPERVGLEKNDRWEGEAIVFLGSLLEEYKGARKFRIRLALSDSRPADLEGPGVGYSEWLEFELDRNAESLVRQELRQQDRDVRETVQEVIQDLQKARNKMHEGKGGLHKDEVTEQGEKALAEARDKLKAGQDKLTHLAERMKQGVQDHRRDEVAAAVEKLEIAKESVSAAPLQDTPEARKSEVDRALRETEAVLKDLYKLREDVQKDQPKTDDLAKLEEMAQRQESLAKEASEKEPDDDWGHQQRQMRDKIRQKVKESPTARAAAMAAQSEQAMELAKEAALLQESQESLAELGQDSKSKEEMLEVLEQALAREQAAVVEGVKEELSEARRAQEGRANDLPEALAQAETALENAQKREPSSAAEAAKKAARELGKGAEGSASQTALQETQEDLSEALRNLTEGRSSQARAALEEMQAERAAELAEEIQGIAEVEGNDFRSAEQQAKLGAQKAMQASQSQQAGKEAEASKQHEEAARKFFEAGQSLERAAKQLAKRAEQAAKQAEDPRRAPAPGEDMAEALEQSSKAAEAAEAGDTQEAAASSTAAAKALRKAAQEAKATMKRGGKPGEEMASGEGPDLGQDPSEGAEDGLREGQGDQGVPPELAKLGMSVTDWEKIKATMTTDVSGSRRSVIPDDYRDLVRKYFKEVTKER